VSAILRLSFNIYKDENMNGHRNIFTIGHNNIVLCYYTLTAGSTLAKLYALRVVYDQFLHEIVNKNLSYNKEILMLTLL